MGPGDPPTHWGMTTAPLRSPVRTHARHGRPRQSQDSPGSAGRNMDKLGHRDARRRLGGARRAVGLGGDQRLSNLRSPAVAPDRHVQRPRRRPDWSPDCLHSTCLRCACRERSRTPASTLDAPACAQDATAGCASSIATKEQFAVSPVVALSGTRSTVGLSSGCRRWSSRELFVRGQLSPRILAFSAANSSSLRTPRSFRSASFARRSTGSEPDRPGEPDERLTTDARVRSSHSEQLCLEVPEVPRGPRAPRPPSRHRSQS